MCIWYGVVYVWYMVWGIFIHTFIMYVSVCPFACLYPFARLRARAFIFTCLRSVRAKELALFVRLSRHACSVALGARAFLLPPSQPPPSPCPPRGPSVTLAVYGRLQVGSVVSQGGDTPFPSPSSLPPLNPSSPIFLPSPPPSSHIVHIILVIPAYSGF